MFQHLSTRKRCHPCSVANAEESIKTIGTSLLDAAAAEVCSRKPSRDRQQTGTPGIKFYSGVPGESSTNLLQFPIRMKPKNKSHHAVSVI
ncbi:hypothetical protein F1559_005172 [Cyanidiococcus yangmingshanensis]|uniref:Uncharacterized protein n=1 Tax=Cyanidiococcus yangmingshanensis TaxID=2690220 RepID=A0A7J7IFB1_9RHOD|nr:hypothetical protein F1559_005172 [Cyanidiococcus yangmingshanensis]